jgi:hypothetical protein
VDLSDPTAPVTHVLVTDNSWSWGGFSNDASFIWLLGGSDEWGRALHVFDLLDPALTPRLVLNCTSAGGSEARCPMSAQFQPLAYPR